MEFCELYSVVFESGYIIYEAGAECPVFDSISGFLTSYTDEEWENMLEKYSHWIVTEIYPSECGLTVTLKNPESKRSE